MIWPSPLGLFYSLSTTSASLQSCATIPDKCHFAHVSDGAGLSSELSTEAQHSPPPSPSIPPPPLFNALYSFLFWHTWTSILSPWVRRYKTHDSSVEKKEECTGNCVVLQQYFIVLLRAVMTAGFYAWMNKESCESLVTKHFQGVKPLWAFIRSI